MKKNTRSIPYVGSKQGIALELIDEMLKYKPKDDTNKIKR